MTIKIFAFLIALTFHEFANASTAFKLGGITARNKERLSINPKRLIDLLGTVLFPFTMILSQSSVIFGWAKPVPMNLSNFNNKHIGIFLTSLSGPKIN